MSFKLWLEAKDKAPWVYHITYVKNLPGIFQSVLKPMGGYSPWIDLPIFKDNISKGVFFSSTLRGAMSWLQSLYDDSYRYRRNKNKDVIPLDYIPVIIRFKHNMSAWRQDDAGNTDSYYSGRNINPLGIQVWDGEGWNSDVQRVMNNLKNIRSNITHDRWGSLLSYPGPPETSENLVSAN